MTRSAADMGSQETDIYDIIFAGGATLSFTETLSLKLAHISIVNDNDLTIM
jgi:hypothetical protein